MNVRKRKRLTATQATATLTTYVPLTSDFQRSSVMTQLVVAFQCHGLDHALRELESIIAQYNAALKPKRSAKHRKVKTIMPQEQYQAIRVHFSRCLLSTCLGVSGVPCRVQEQCQSHIA